MHRSYATVVEPVIQALRPRTIAEIGAGSGRLTARLLTTLGAGTPRIHAIDPAPAFTPAQIGDDTNRVSVHRELADSALGRIAAIDLLLIDGDPNWYSVTRTLEIAAKSAREERNPLPVMLIHNVHWPFGRRDGYHDPSALPQHAVNPHTEAGLSPVSGKPLEEGLRLTPFVAIAEHGDRNGVMTAIEDFTRADSDAWKLVDVPGFGGTALLVAAARVAAEPELRALLGFLDARDGLKRVARRVEAGRVDAEVRALQAQRTEAQPTEARRAEADAIAAELRERTEELELEVRELLEHRARHEAAVDRITSLERALTARETERLESIAAQDAQTQATQSALVALERSQTDLAVAQAALETTRQQLRDSESRVAEQSERIEDLAEAERLLGGRVLHLQDMLQAAREEYERERDAHEQTAAALRETHVDAAQVALAVRAARLRLGTRITHRIRRAFRTLTLRKPLPSQLDQALELAEQRPKLSAAVAPSDPQAPGQQPADAMRRASADRAEDG